MTGRNGPPNLHAFCLIYCGFQQVGVMKDCSKVVILMISRAVRMDVNPARGDQYDDDLLEGMSLRCDSNLDRFQLIGVKTFIKSAIHGK